MEDFFTLSFVHVRGALIGSGRRKTYLPGHQASTRLKEFKRCVLRVPEEDYTQCCPRAIYGVHQGVHQAERNMHQQWIDPQRNQRRVNRAAMGLLREIHLPPQPCGPEELHLPATAPSVHDYTIIVVDDNHAFSCFAYGCGNTLLGLLHEDGHYDAFSSLPGFLSRSYFCS